MKTSAKCLGVTMVSSEVVPFSKTGGLADVVAGLSGALSASGHDVSVITPLYRGVDRTELRRSNVELHVPLGDDLVSARVWEAHSAQGVVTYFLDIPELYDRSGLYGEGGVDFPDNARRFAALARGALELLVERGKACDIVHVHDWQAALIPLQMKSIYANEPHLASARSVLTLHNLAYQGIFDLANLPETGLGTSYTTPRHLEFYGSMSFLKAGIVAADALTAVSPTYAREMLTNSRVCWPIDRPIWLGFSTASTPPHGTPRPTSTCRSATASGRCRGRESVRPPCSGRSAFQEQQRGR